MDIFNWFLTIEWVRVSQFHNFAEFGSQFGCDQINRSIAERNCKTHIWSLNPNKCNFPCRRWDTDLDAAPSRDHNFSSRTSSKRSSFWRKFWANGLKCWTVNVTNKNMDKPRPRANHQWEKDRYICSLWCVLIIGQL